MSFLRGTYRSLGDGSAIGARVIRADVLERRTSRSRRLCEGTLACPRCDAPIATGGEALALTERLACPFCRHQAPTRDFLSLATPTRPARVVVRATWPVGQPNR